MASASSGDSARGGPRYRSTCDSAKIRLLPVKLCDFDVQLLRTAVAAKTPDLMQVKELKIDEDGILKDMGCVLANDLWNGQRSGKLWLREWLQHGMAWAMEAEQGL